MQVLHGTVHRVLVSQGGVPKTPIDATDVGETGLVGDRQAHPKFHGGPTRAVCLLGLDVIERLRSEGHPIEPGWTGENLTIAGVDWGQVGIGARFRFENGLELEALSYAQPCATIKAAFTDGKIAVFEADAHPENARIYARVNTTGRVATGEAVTIEIQS